jgi:hypothetical protein
MRQFLILRGSSQRSLTFWIMSVRNNRPFIRRINLQMDKLIADVKKLLEESDPTITVEESLPPPKPNGADPDLDNEPMAASSLQPQSTHLPN